MSAILSPNGLVAVQPNSGGTPRASRIRFYGTTTNPTTGVTTKNYNTATTFYQGQPLQITAAGLIDAAPSVAASASTTRIYGVFNGAEYIDPNGRRSLSSWYSDSLAATNVAPDVWFWIYTDPNQVYEAQFTGALTSPNVATGTLFNFSATAGYTPTSGVVVPGGVGYSTMGINPTPVATNTLGQLRFIEWAYGIDNSPYDSQPRARFVVANYEEYTPALSQ